jgi:hypothetical protein
MYVRIPEKLGRGFIPYTGGLSNSYIGEPDLSLQLVCPRYEKGEIEKSHCQQGSCQQGHLVTDVMRHNKGLLIADFGVGWHGIKAATKKEKLLYDWMREAKSDLYSIILNIYGYSDCVGSEKNNIELRRKRAQRVYMLLNKDLQSRVGFKGAARTGTYVADNKTKEGRAKNRGVIIELLPATSEEVIHVRGEAPRTTTCTTPDCKQVPPPPPWVQQRSWKVVGKLSWKGKKRRLAKRGYFEIYNDPEVEATISVNATDAEFATFSGKWDIGKGPGGQFETKFNKWFVPDMKVERGKDGWKVSFKKGVKLLGEKLVFTPHLQLSTELVKLQVELKLFNISDTFLGQEVRIVVKPKGNIIIKIDLWQVLKDRLKEKTKDFLRHLLENLIKHFGKGLLGSLVGKFLAGLLGGVLAHLFVSPSPTTPVMAPPDDINGKDRALTQAGGTMAAAEILQKWADTHRHAFAKAYADTMLHLSSEKWQAQLVDLRSRSVKGYKALPALNAPDKEWQVWASTRKALQMISIDLPTDNFARRFRWYELMLMFAIAAWILRRMTKEELDEVKGIALQQASVAGMAAAVQYVNRRIVAETFEFIDEHGKIQQANGIEHWDTVGKLVRSSQLSNAEISKRLEQLGIKQLPGIPKIA